MVNDLRDRQRRPRGIVASFVCGVLFLALLIWQFTGVGGNGGQIQVLDPDLGLVWKVSVAAFVAVSIACSLVVWVRRRWTTSLAAVNTLVNLAVAGVTVLLTLTGQLFDPTLPAEIGAIFGTSSDRSELIEPFILGVLVIAFWDSVDGLVQARGPAIGAAGAGR